jgi:uncharacterized protein YrrD
MDLKLGMRAQSPDGQPFSSIDRIIPEPDTHEVFGNIAHNGLFFSEDRVIEAGFIESAADDTVLLRLIGTKADQLPRFVEHEFVVLMPEQLRKLPYQVDGGVSGSRATVLPLLWRSTYLGRDFQPGSNSLLESAAVDAPQIEILSNLLDDALMVDKGTDLIAHDGARIGKVDDVIVVDGALGGLLVRTGVVHHHDVSIPVETIESVTSKHVRLRVDAVELRASSGSEPVPVDTTPS